MGLLDIFRTPRVQARTVRVAIDGIKGMDAAKLYATQPALRSVVSFLADNVAGLPLKCYVRRGDTDRPRDTDSALALAVARPNPWTTTHELVRSIASEYLLYDQALVYSVPSNDSESGWFMAVIPNSWVERQKTRDGFTVSTYKVTNPYTGKVAEFDPADVIRFSGWSPGGMDAESRVEALKQVLAEQVSAWAFRSATWKNGGRVTQWIGRPKDAPWTEQARDRFANSWKAKFSGDDGTDTGGTPLLEDGMTLNATQFNAREAQWAEATRLTREDVCAVYHVNPSLIYHTDAQTYASAKDNARALYSDTLSPLLDMVEERLNAFLVPAMGFDRTHYVEFDLDAKLAASFEERAAIMQSSVGAPWLTRNEARAMLNLPAIEGGDELVTPLNVLTGGLSSPNDTAPDGLSAKPEAKAAPLSYKAAPDEDEAGDVSDAMRRFFERQARSVLAAIGKGGKDADAPGWWNGERWDRELAADLAPVFQRIAARQGRRTARALGVGFDENRIENYIAAMAAGKAHAANEVTLRQLRAALDGDVGEGAEGSTPEGVFAKAGDSRADTAGRSFATALAGFAAMEVMRQNGGGWTKTWVVTSGNPRATHAAMDGETVPYKEPFSNGAMWPGDDDLDPEESCGCQCQIEITAG